MTIDLEIFSWPDDVIEKGRWYLMKSLATSMSKMFKQMQKNLISEK